MLERDDPRLPLISDVRVDSLANQHKGLRNGFSIGSSQIDDIESYSRVRWEVCNPVSPTFFLTHAEVEFLLAEAAIRGFIATNATEHYQKGMESALKQYEIYDAQLSIPDTTINHYLFNQSLSDNFDTALQQINTQYWAATFLNGFEAYANWRRSGCPVLAVYGMNVDKEIPRRLPYPLVEYSVNGAQVQAAVARQGADVMGTRIWWDEE